MYGNGYYVGFDMTYIILVIPAILFALIAQIQVKSTYSRYSKVASQRGITGREVAERILSANGISGVGIEQIGGSLTDHYDPKADVIRLSSDIYNSTSVAALGIAAHEAGHTCQHHEEYTPIKIRNAVFPVARIGSQMAMPLVLVGLIFNFYFLMEIGIICYMAATLFQIVTLPVEFNASRRAMKSLSDYGILSDTELKQTRKVLTAAALTYVASLFVSLMSLLRLILLANGRRRR